MTPNVNGHSRKKARRPKDDALARSHDNPPGPLRIARVSAQAFLRAEMQVPLDRQAEPSANGRQLLQADPAEFRCSQAQVAQAERMVVIVRVDLGQQPGRAGVRRPA